MPRPTRLYEESDDDDEYERDDVQDAAAASDEDGEDGADEEHDGRSSSGGRRRGDRDRASDDDGRRKRKSRKKVKVMEESGQTDEDRRLLRKAQRDLQRRIVQGEEGEQLEDPGSDMFEVLRGENNELWDDVRFTREAVLDGDNVELISRRAARQVDKLVQVPRYDAVRFSQKLRSKLTAKAGSTSYFDWRTLGAEVGTCFNAVPSRVSFLNGPIDVEYVPKERKKRERRTSEEEEEDEEEEQPEELKQKHQKADADKLSAVEKNINTVNTVLSKRTREGYAEEKARLEGMADTMAEEEKKRWTKRMKKHGGEVDAVTHLFNPKSFTQTVENIFHFSFLVKKGTAGIRVRTEEESKEFGGAAGPVVKAYKLHEGLIPKQAIVTLNMQDWRDMCAAYKVKECDIPHRKGSKHSRSSAKAGK